MSIESLMIRPPGKYAGHPDPWPADYKLVHHARNGPRRSTALHVPRRHGRGGDTQSQAGLVTRHEPVIRATNVIQCRAGLWWAFTEEGLPGSPWLVWSCRNNLNPGLLNWGQRCGLRAGGLVGDCISRDARRRVLGEVSFLISRGPGSAKPGQKALPALPIDASRKQLAPLRRKQIPRFDRGRWRLSRIENAQRPHRSHQA